MRPITAKGGITGTDLPRVTGKVKIKLVELRPKFKIPEVDKKALDKLCKMQNVSQSEWIRIRVMRALGNDI